MDKTIKEILDSAIGLNEDGTAKVGVAISLEMMNAITRQIEHIDDIVFWENQIDIKRHDAFLQIDFIYNTEDKGELKTLWDIIDNVYSNALDETADDANRTPMCLVTIMPFSLGGEYYIQGVNPIFWSLQPKKPGSTYSIVRMKFEERDVQFLKGELDQEEILSETRKNQNLYEMYSGQYEEDSDDEEIDFS